MRNACFRSRSLEHVIKDCQKNTNVQRVEEDKPDILFIGNGQNKGVEDEWRKMPVKVSWMTSGRICRVCREPCGHVHCRTSLSHSQTTKGGSGLERQPIVHGAGVAHHKKGGREEARQVRQGREGGSGQSVASLTDEMNRPRLVHVHLC